MDAKVDYSNISKVSITTKDDRKIDVRTFNDGYSRSKFSLGYRIINQKPDKIKIKTLSKEGEIINQEYINLEYESQKVGLIYRMIRKL